MFYQLPPVGNPVQLYSRDKTPLNRAASNFPAVFLHWDIQFYDSGTSALAAAMIAARTKKFGTGYAGDAEVIIPAYGCPDLIAAAVYAGLKPVLVDLQASRPWMDLQAVADAVSAATVAIIAVDLFGIPERLSRLRPIADKAEIVLIEDSAQGFPAQAMTRHGEAYWQGDLVVLSFGRGKPVSLLGGGAVLSPQGNNSISALLPQLPSPKDNAIQRLRYRLKAQLYNVMLHPRLYWLPAALPFLHLGETAYHPLSSIAGLDRLRKKLLMANIHAYYGYDEHALAINRYTRTALQGNENIINLAAVCELPEAQRLLRYPLLLPASERDHVVHCLNQNGRGASIMYAAAIPEIHGLEQVLDKQKLFPCARDFAARLLTLPMHGLAAVDAVDVLSGCLHSI